MLSAQLASTSKRSRAAAELAAREQLACDEVDLVTWHRELPPGLEPQLASWVQHHPATFDRVVTLQSHDLTEATSGLAEPARAWLTADLAELLARLADLAQTRRLRVSFGAVRTDQCRKFHVDHVRYRLVTTYLGPGTEWVPEHAVDRAALAHPASCPCDANKSIVRDEAAVRHAIAGDVLLMKGARHPSQRGAVHRSPPIEGTRQVRVVLVASTVDGS